MARLLVLIAIATLLLAGCSAPHPAPASDPGAEPSAAGPKLPAQDNGATPATPPAPSGPHTDVTVLKGSLLGAGANLPAGGHPFAGSFSFQMPFEVGANASSLTLELDWATPAHDLFLRVRDPGGSESFAATATPFVSPPPVRMSVDNPVEGTWKAHAESNGVADTDYTITVTVAYL
ncbi:MAG: hypothetical protein LC623_02325 [Halobacteriales archaeon]|nr:hypothetical protein [Halobacteriales archaeon]